MPRTRILPRITPKVHERIARICDWEECLAPSGPSHCIHGSAYCPDHYYPALEKHFLDELQNWDGKSEPTKKFRNLLGRHAISLYDERGEVPPDALTEGELKRRSSKLQRSQNGITFDMERHMNAFSRTKPVVVLQTWEFDLTEGVLTRKE